MIRLTVVVSLIGFGTYLAVSWLLSMWLRLRKAGQPFTLQNLFLLTPYEIERNEEERDAVLELGDVGWAKQLAAPHLYAEIRARVAEGESWSNAVEHVLGGRDNVES